MVSLPFRAGVAYDFRIYSLRLLGAVGLIPAIAGLRMTARMGRGLAPRRRDLRRSFGGLLAINLPLIPLQDFAIALSIAGIAALLLCAKSETPSRPEA